MAETANGVTDKEPNNLEKKIIKQIEYYFGDVNIMKDKFMQGEIKNDDGWITMETMLKFNRLKQLSDNVDVILNALKKSTSGLMEIHEGREKIRRSPDKPIPAFDAKRREDLKNRSIYAKGFPKTATMDDLINFFDSYGPPDNIQMRRDMNRQFKGSVFVIFKTKEEADNFVKADSIKHEDAELVRRTKDDYFRIKQEEKKIN